MPWSVAYHEHDRFVERSSRTHTWLDLPTEGVLWVDVRDGEYRHRLSGFDAYWLHGRRFGVLNDAENAEWYPGEQALAWEWTGSGSRRVNASVPSGARVLRGVLVPDEVARAVGLLGPNDSLPPRPN